MTTYDDRPLADPPPPPPPSPPPGSPVRRLERGGPGDRWVGGVCSGLGRYTDVDPVVFRVVLAVLTLFGGAGVALYALGWVLIPAVGSPTSPAERVLSRERAAGRRPEVGTAAAVVVAAVLAVVVLGNGEDVPVVALVVALVAWLVLRRTGAAPAAVSAYEAPSTAAAGGGGSVRIPWPSDLPTASYGGGPATVPPPKRRRLERSALAWLTLSALAVVLGIALTLDQLEVLEVSGRGLVAIALLVVGSGLLVGTRWGRSRGLVVVGAALTVALLGAAAGETELRTGTGKRMWQPVSITGLSSPYVLGAGEATLDLRGLRDTPVAEPIEARLGAGRLLVLVPAGAAIDVDATVGMGEIDLLGDLEGGLGNDLSVDRPGAPDNRGSLTLDLSVGMGELEVRDA